METKEESIDQELFSIEALEQLLNNDSFLADLKNNDLVADIEKTLGIDTSKGKKREYPFQEDSQKKLKLEATALIKALLQELAILEEKHAKCLETRNGLATHLASLYGKPFAHPPTLEALTPYEGAYQATQQFLLKSKIAPLLFLLSSDKRQQLLSLLSYKTLWYERTLTVLFVLLQEIAAKTIRTKVSAPSIADGELLTLLQLDQLCLTDSEMVKIVPSGYDPFRQDLAMTLLEWLVALHSINLHKKFRQFLKDESHALKTIFERLFTQVVEKYGNLKGITYTHFFLLLRFLEENTPIHEVLIKHIKEYLRNLCVTYEQLEAIKDLIKTSIQTILAAEETNDTFQCPICLEPCSLSSLEDMHTIHTTSCDCQSYYHKDCLNTVLQEHKKCPTCRKENVRYQTLAIQIINVE